MKRPKPPSASRDRPDQPLPLDRRLRGVRSLRLTGRGRIVIHLCGSGRVTLQRGRVDDFSFEGRGLPKHVSAEQVHLDRADGVLTLEGNSLRLEFSGGTVDAEIAGSFEIDQQGGQIEPDLPTSEPSSEEPSSGEPAPRLRLTGYRRAS